MPEVEVIELPEDPAGYIKAIETAKPFPMHTLTREDLSRSQSYQTIATGAGVTDMEGFLSGLQATLHVEEVNSTTVARIAQLFAKTNQFRFNGSKYDEAALLARPDDVYALRLVDRLQDYGIIAVLVVSEGDQRLTIDNWAMSCRIFQRRVEHSTIGLISARAAWKGLKGLSVTYVPTTKNVILPPVLGMLGFEQQADGLWLRDGNAVPEINTHITIVDHRRNHDR